MHRGKAPLKRTLGVNMKRFIRLALILGALAFTVLVAVPMINELRAAGEHYMVVSLSMSLGALVVLMIVVWARLNIPKIDVKGIPSMTNAQYRKHVAALAKHHGLQPTEVHRIIREIFPGLKQELESLPCAERVPSWD
jgi:hypothetical protein